jgi:hypothetical protein
MNRATSQSLQATYVHPLSSLLLLTLGFVFSAFFRSPAALANKRISPFRVKFCFSRAGKHILTLSRYAVARIVATLIR